MASDTEKSDPSAGHEAGGHGHHSGGHDHGGHSTLGVSAHATLHCLIGCYIGDAIGLSIGIALGLGPWMSMALAVVGAYIAGFTLAMIPIMRKSGLSAAEAMRVVWLGEAISIATMEVVINGIDFWIGGVQVSSIGEPLFWIGLAAAAPPAFLAAWPVNHWLLKKQIKKHH